MKKKKNINNYFTEQTQEALIKYTNEEDANKRNIIFRTELEYPLYKLSENLINILKCYYISDDFKEIQHIAVNYMLSKIKTHPIDPSRGKAYSYLTRITFNYLIQANRKAYKEIKRKKPLTSAPAHISDNESDHSKLYFFDFLVEYLDENSEHIFLDEQELEIVYAIIVIMKRTHNFGQLNKKKIYLYIKEMLNLTNNIKITATKKKLQVLYKHLYPLFSDDVLTLSYVPSQEIFNEL